MSRRIAALLSLSLSSVCASACMSTSSGVLSSSSNTLSSTSSALTSGINVSPSSPTITPGSTLQMSASGGSPPYSYSLASGTGSINAATGLYTAPTGSTTAAEVVATDQAGSTGETVVTVEFTALVITPSTVTVPPSGTYQFEAGGGAAPYTFQLLYGLGTITASGLFAASSTSGAVQVSVMDANGSQAYSAVTVGTSAGTTNVNAGCSLISGIGLGSVSMTCDSSEAVSSTADAGSCGSAAQTGVITSPNYTVGCNAGVTASGSAYCCANRVAGNPYTRTITGSSTGALQLYCGVGETVVSINSSNCTTTGAVTPSYQRSSAGQGGYSETCLYTTDTASMTLQCQGVTPY